MSINLNRNSDYEVVLEQVVDGPEWKEEQRKAFQALKANLQPKGFRAGKVPDQVARKMISPERIYYAAVSPMAQKVLNDAVEEYDLVLVDQPVLDFAEPSDDSVKIILKLTVRPDAKLGQYKDLGIEKEDTQLTEEEYQNVLSNILEPYGNWVVVEDEARDGDLLMVDYESRESEGPFAGLSGSDLELELGKNPARQAVYDQLIGIRPEEGREVEIELSEDAKGKVFITVNEVQRKELPELNDEFVQEYKLADNAAEYEERLRKDLQQQKETIVNDQYLDQVMSAILENTQEMEFPEVMVDERIALLLNQSLSQMASQGLDIKPMIAQINEEPETYKAMMRDQALQSLAVDAILLQIAREENLEAEAQEREQREFELRRKAVDFLLK